MAHFSPLRILAAAVSLASFAAAQVSTACQPLNTTGCPADPAFGTDLLFHFNSTPSSTFWETTAGSVSYSGENGAAFTINQQGDSPTIRSAFYIFFGRTEMMIKAAPGTGIISSVMFLSDDLDEIDWEFMGGNASFVETNYFGKGRQDYHNAIYHPVSGGTEADFHNYTTVWTNTSLAFYVDGANVRTLLPKDANGTNNYPQTPMRISLGIWAGGDPSLPKGTRDWAGGTTDYTKGPFSMFVKSAQVTDYSTGKEYSYGDYSGSWQSIKITAGNSTAVETINAKPPLTLSEKWNNLGSVAHIAVYASAAGVGAIIAAVGLYYCIKQRRRGREENRLYEERLAQERLELEQFKKNGIDPDSLRSTGADYDAKEMNSNGSAFSSAYNIPQTPDSVADEKERAWGAAATGAGAGALAGAGAGFDRGLRNNNALSQQPRIQSPAPIVAPMRSPSPGMVSPVSSHGYEPRGYGASTSRSFSSPNTQMRGSPGPADMGLARSQSPAFVQPTPVRSYTANSYHNLANSNEPSFNGYAAARNNGPSFGDNNYWR